MDTSPGYTLTSPTFAVKFVSAEQKRKVSFLLEYETDWKEVMQILLACLETCPRSTPRAAALASRKIEEWALLQEGGLELDLKIRTVFRADPHRRQEDAHKTIVLIFNDLFDTEIFFDVRKKKRLVSLVELSARVVASTLASPSAIWRLEVPRSLTTDLGDAFMDSWRTNSTSKASPKVKKLAKMSITNMKALKDCPYCKRTGFKSLRRHIPKSKSCKMKHERQVGFEGGPTKDKAGKSLW